MLFNQYGIWRIFNYYSIWWWKLSRAHIFAQVLYCSIGNFNKTKDLNTVSTTAKYCTYQNCIYNYFYLQCLCSNDACCSKMTHIPKTPLSLKCLSLSITNISCLDQYIWRWQTSRFQAGLRSCDWGCNNKGTINIQPLRGRLLSDWNTLTHCTWLSPFRLRWFLSQLQEGQGRRTNLFPVTWVFLT